MTGKQFTELTKRAFEYVGPEGEKALADDILAVIHGFILISLYNVQYDMEDPFDQIGLDDIKLEEFHFEKAAPVNHSTPVEKQASAS